LPKKDIAKNWLLSLFVNQSAKSPNHYIQLTPRAAPFFGGLFNRHTPAKVIANATAGQLMLTLCVLATMILFT
jgi:hypothetical protein